MSEKQQPSEKRRRWTAKAKLEVVLEGLRGQESVAEICRRHGIIQSMYYEWQEAVFKAAEEGLTRDAAWARDVVGLLWRERKGRDGTGRAAGALPAARAGGLPGPARGGPREVGG